jgi:hypothetical protein
MLNKPVCETHPFLRARELYDVELSPAAFSDMHAQIATGTSVCVHKTTTAELHLVGFDQIAAASGEKLGRIAMVALYRPDLKLIVTFFPREAAYRLQARTRLLRQEMQDHAPEVFRNGKAILRGKRVGDKKSSARTRHERQHAKNQEGYGYE